MEALIGLAIEEVALEGSQGAWRANGPICARGGSTDSAGAPLDAGCKPLCIKDLLQERLPLPGLTQLTDEVFAWVWRNLCQQESALEFRVR
jgi:hypothetical protein